MFFFRLLLRVLLLVVVFVTIGLGVMFYSDLKQLGEGYYAYYRGNMAYNNRQYEQALNYYNHALQAFPDNSVYIHTRIGDAYLRLGQHNTAILHYKKALEIDPNSTRALAKLARAEWILGHEQVALGLYFDAIQSHPNNAQLRASMGDLYLSKAKETNNPKYYEKAITALERAIEKDKGDANAFTRYKLAESYYAQGQYEQSLAIYCELATKYSNNPETMYSLAAAFAKNGAYEDAHIYMGRAAELINLRRPELSGKWAQHALKFQQIAAHRVHHFPKPAVEDCRLRLAEAEAARAEKEE